VKPIFAAFGLTLFGLAINGAATLLGDRTTLVAPPDARVESFLRQLATERSELALEYLSRGLRRRVSASELRDRFAAIEQQIGTIENVTAQTLSLDRQTATARAELAASRSAKVPLGFGLRWEHGEWAIEDLPDLLRRPAAD
jgi:hypothetical protein